MPMPRGFYPATEATAPDKIEALTEDQLHRYYKGFAEAEEWLVDQPHVKLCRDRMEQIQRQLEIRRNESHADRQHRESLALNQQTLGVAQETLVAGKSAVYWAKWAVAAAIVIPIVLALIAEIPFSRLRPAKASQSPTPSPQQSSPADEMPIATTPPSAMLPASKTPAAEATPEP